MRKTSVPPPQWRAPELTGQRIDMQLRVITPLFGGGYEAREVDPLNIIRPAAIRGHLRFWWRATAGARYSNPSDLYRAEAALWGSAAQPSPVSIQVAVTSPGQDVRCSSIAPPRSSPRAGPQEGYFIWPFQEQRGAERRDEARARTGVEFSLSTSFHAALPYADKVSEIRRALMAWIAFGGLGARTRRGCGALQLLNTDALAAPPLIGPALSDWLRALAGTASLPPAHTVLGGGSLVIGAPSESAMECWKRLGTFWARFRKGHVGGKEYSPMKGCDWSDYRQGLVPRRRDATTVTLAKPYLGLPINYQAFDSAPFSGSIEAADTTRMASPVILKPVLFADGKFRPVVLIISSPGPERVKIKGSQPLKLQVPENDPVLQRLETHLPLDAVLIAATQEFGAPATQIGAAP